MARQFISKTSFLCPVVTPINKVTLHWRTVQALQLFTEVKEAASVRSFIKEIFERCKSKGKPIRHDDGGADMLLVLTDLQTVEERDLSKIAPTAKDYSKTYYTVLHNTKNEFLKDLQTVINHFSTSGPTIEVKTDDGFLPRYYYRDEKKVLTPVAPIIQELQHFKESLSELSLPEINTKPFTLKEYQTTEIDSAKLYYAIYDEKFISMSKTRQTSQTKFTWSLTKNRTEAFLFTGELNAYHLPYDISRINRLFVDVKISGVEMNVASPLSEEMGIKIEKRDIDEIIVAPVERSKSRNKL